MGGSKETPCTHRLSVAPGLFVVFAAHFLWLGSISTAFAADGWGRYESEIRPILKEYCFDCHGDGSDKGKVTLDQFAKTSFESDPDLWWRVLKNLQVGLMPPAKKPQPSVEQKNAVAAWIKDAVFHFDPKHPDPGRVTVRRLNRVEYRNTIRDLVDVDFDTSEEFPADDAGYGFDNIGDVLTVSPMLLEKYLEAARTVVAKAVPVAPRTPAERPIETKDFERTGDWPTNAVKNSTIAFSYYNHSGARKSVTVDAAGKYQLLLDLTAAEKFVDNVFDYNKCRLTVREDGRELMNREFIREGGRPFHFEFDLDWKAGAHELTFDVEPVAPHEKQVRNLNLKVNSLTLRGPMDEQRWVRPRNFDRFFGHDAPKGARERRQFARDLLSEFAAKAWRRPVDARSADRLAALAESLYKLPHQTFEAGVAQAMVAVLASPRFIFREEDVRPDPAGGAPFLDDYALASRLSYFLWSTMPDDELRKLAAAGTLREHVPDQLKRMLADSRSKALVKNFAGQWLQLRDLDTIQIDARSVFAREEKQDPKIEEMRARFRAIREKPDDKRTKEEKEAFPKLREEFQKSFAAPKVELTTELRQAMRAETEAYFEYVIREDRPLTEFLDSDYTFLNERLAKHYGVPGVTGPDIRKVTLPADSPRGGLITQGSILVVTSNPTRTSPVKRGVFLLDNIFGAPAPPPPANVPPLEDVAKAQGKADLSLRASLEIHREKPLCASCHNRMDPPGLALENFNALGLWRTAENSGPVESNGRLITGEEFQNVRELKHIIATRHARDFERCLSEKLLTYALGRGLDHHDAGVLDQILERTDAAGGKFSAMIAAVVDSPQFQRRRDDASAPDAKPATQHAALDLKP
jgi:mono/diheme cytochrome c family protein